jgi:hypothetical protein
MGSRMATAKESATVDKHDLEKLRSEIADALLEPNALSRSMPEFDECINEHDQLITTQGKLASILPRLEDAIPYLERVEFLVSEAHENLRHEEKTLAAYAGELGKSGYAGFQAGQLPAHPRFSDRDELKKKVCHLQAEKANIPIGEANGVIDQAKCKALQLKLASKILVGKRRIPAANKSLGKAVLSSNSENLLHCTQTEQVLTRVAEQRARITSSLDRKLKAEQELRNKLSQAAKTLDRPTVIDAASLTSEHKNSCKHQRHIEKMLVKVRNTVVDTALGQSLLLDNGMLGLKLKQLHDWQAELGESSPNAKQLVDRSIVVVNNLPGNSKFWLLGTAGVAASLLAFAFMGKSDTDRERTNDSPRRLQTSLHGPDVGRDKKEHFAAGTSSNSSVKNGSFAASTRQSKRKSAPLIDSKKEQASYEDRTLLQGILAYALQNSAKAQPSRNVAPLKTGPSPILTRSSQHARNSLSGSTGTRRPIGYETPRNTVSTVPQNNYIRSMHDLSAAASGIPSNRAVTPSYQPPYQSQTRLGNSNPLAHGMSSPSSIPKSYGGYKHFDSNSNSVGSSIPNSYGGYKHFDSNSNSLGSSVPNSFGGVKHFDSNSNSLGSSIPNSFGGVKHFDSNGNTLGTSVPNSFGGVKRFDSNGNTLGTSVPNSFGGFKHFDSQGRQVGSSQSNGFFGN